MRPETRWYIRDRLANMKENTLADAAPINWTNAMTLLSVAILVGTSLWAPARPRDGDRGFFQLGLPFTRGLEGLLILVALPASSIFCALRLLTSRSAASGSRLSIRLPSQIVGEDHDFALCELGALTAEPNQRCVPLANRERRR